MTIVPDNKKLGNGKSPMTTMKRYSWGDCDTLHETTPCATISVMKEHNPIIKETTVFFSSFIGIFTILTLIVTGCFIIHYATAQWSVGVNPDSLIFIDTAQNIIAGNGITAYVDGTQKPLTHFPPLYPLTLAAGGVISGKDPFVVARWVNIGTFALLLGYIARVVWYITNRTCWLSILVVGILILAPHILFIHTLAMSEPLFLVFTIITFFLLARYREVAHTRILVLASITSSMALLTRYPGIALILTGSIELFFFCPSRTFRKRVQDTLLFILLACTPMAFWIGRNMVLAENATNRTLAFHPPGLSHIRGFFYTLSTWVIPYSTSYTIHTGLRIILTGVFLVGCLFFWKRNISFRQYLYSFIIETPIARIASLFIAIYIGFILISISFFDYQTPLDYRLLLPVYLAILLIIAVFIHYDTENKQMFVKKRVILSVSLITMSILYIFVSSELMLFLHTNGWKYSGRRWQESALIEETAQIHPSIPIYTNAPNILRFIINRDTLSLPYKFHRTSLLPNETYAIEIATMREDIVHRDALIVYFTRLSWTNNIPTPEELQQELPLEPVVIVEDGILYAYSR